MDDILIATDGYTSGDHAVDQGVDLARRSGAAVTIVYVRRTPPPVLGEPFYQRSLSAEFRHAEKTAARAAARAGEAGVDADTELVDGDPAGRVLELARARDVDLIVVGSRGRGPIAGALLGSVSREILHRADRPVLVAAHRAERRRAA